MKAGDLVVIYFEPPTELATRKPITFEIVPEAGTPVRIGPKTPASYGKDAFVVVR